MRLFFIFFAILSLQFTTSLNASGAALPSYTFWYGVSPPVDLLSQFDRIIVEADNLSEKEIGQLKQHGGKVLAYLSLGENNSKRVSIEKIDPQWILGANTSWASSIMDLSAQGWQQYILKRADQLQQLGADGFFLDTMDSYHQLQLPLGDLKKQQDGLAAIVQQLKQLNPNFSLVANRGFEIMPAIAPHLEAVAAESLYRGWDNSKQRYLPVTASDRTWLKTALNTIKTDYGLDIVILDYLPPEQREAARETAKMIEQDGFIPWIANPSFDYMGIGILETIPRKVLLLYDSELNDHSLAEIDMHRLLALPLEYKGLVPEYINIRDALPEIILKGRYCGVISWLAPESETVHLKPWLKKLLKHKVPIVLLGALDILRDKTIADDLGLATQSNLNINTISIAQQSNLIGFEVEELGRMEDFTSLKVVDSQRNQRHLVMEDDTGNQVDLAVTGDWGGYAAQEILLDEDFEYNGSWVINPFSFLQKALQLPSFPMPTITTENGRRIFFTHVDGDGFMEKFENPSKGYAAQILLEKIFTVYPTPHTISIVEGEIGPDGLYPEQSEALQSIAKEIFRLENVEIASHSFSHPYKWGASTAQRQTGNYNLPIKGYFFNLDREIEGSVQYINKQLAPEGKKTKVLLWTGDCLPTPQAISMASKNKLLNMNGGDTTISDVHPTLTRTSAMGAPFANGEFQTYAAIGNENLYTNDWTGPFYGFRRVIETFKYTEHPKRLKPINIYYHFYSGSKYASLKALTTVFDWALSQEIFPIYASEYIKKVNNYRHIGVARKSDQSWKVSGLNSLKSLRLHQGEGWPQDSSSRNIAGWRALHDGIYLHAGPKPSVEFKLSPQQPNSLRLHQANGRLVEWQQHKNSIDFHIQGNVPVIMDVVTGKQQCSVHWQQGILAPKNRSNNISSFFFPVKDTGKARLECH